MRGNAASEPRADVAPICERAGNMPSGLRELGYQSGANSRVALAPAARYMAEILDGGMAERLKATVC